MKIVKDFAHRIESAEGIEVSEEGRPELRLILAQLIDNMAVMTEQKIKEEARKYGVTIKDKEDLR